MFNLTEKLTGIVRTIAAHVRESEDVPKSEQILVFLDIDYSECTFEDVLSFSNSNRRIAWANGPEGRVKCGKLTKGQHIKVVASSPGAKPPVDPEEAYNDYINTLPLEAKKKALEAQLAKLKAVNAELKDKK